MASEIRANYEQACRSFCQRWFLLAQAIGQFDRLQLYAQADLTPGQPGDPIAHDVAWNAYAKISTEDHSVDADDCT